MVTSTIVFEGVGKEGQIQEYVGGYSDWLRQAKVAPTTKSQQSSVASERGSEKTKLNTEKRLGYKEQRELNKLPTKIETLETQQQQLQDAISSVDFYQQEESSIKLTLNQLQTLDEKIEAAYARWESLSERDTG